LGERFRVEDLMRHEHAEERPHRQCGQRGLEIRALQRCRIAACSSASDHRTLRELVENENDETPGERGRLPRAAQSRVQHETFLHQDPE